MSENDPIKVSGMSFRDKPGSFAGAAKNVAEPATFISDDGLESAWEDEQEFPVKEIREAADKHAELSAVHVAEDHHISDRQHHQSGIPHHH